MKISIFILQTFYKFIKNCCNFVLVSLYIKLTVVGKLHSIRLLQTVRFIDETSRRVIISLLNIHVNNLGKNIINYLISEIRFLASINKLFSTNKNSLEIGSFIFTEFVFFAQKRAQPYRLYPLVLILFSVTNKSLDIIPTR